MFISASCLVTNNSTYINNGIYRVIRRWTIWRVECASGGSSELRSSLKWYACFSQSILYLYLSNNTHKCFFSSSSACLIKFWCCRLARFLLPAYAFAFALPLLSTLKLVWLLFVYVSYTCIRAFKPHEHLRLSFMMRVLVCACASVLACAC